jgi:hypothetical protein
VNDKQPEVNNKTRPPVFRKEWQEKNRDKDQELFQGIIFRLQKDNSVYVTASLFLGGTGGGGTTFIVEMINDTWTITGIVGPEWLS